jgi:hypothetical protein
MISRSIFLTFEELYCKRCHSSKSRAKWRFCLSGLNEWLGRDPNFKTVVSRGYGALSAPYLHGAPTVPHAQAS